MVSYSFPDYPELIPKKSVFFLRWRRSETTSASAPADDALAEATAAAADDTSATGDKADNETDDGTKDAFRLLVSPRVGLVLNPVPQVNAKVLYGRAFRHANVRETLVQSSPDADGFYPSASTAVNLDDFIEAKYDFIDEMMKWGGVGLEVKEATDKAAGRAPAT